MQCRWRSHDTDSQCRLRSVSFGEDGGYIVLPLQITRMQWKLQFRLGKLLNFKFRIHFFKLSLCWRIINRCCRNIITKRFVLFFNLLNQIICLQHSNSSIKWCTVFYGKFIIGFSRGVTRWCTCSRTILPRSWHIRGIFFFLHLYLKIWFPFCFRIHSLNFTWCAVKTTSANLKQIKLTSNFSR